MQYIFGNSCLPESHVDKVPATSDLYTHLLKNGAAAKKSVLTG